MALDKTEQLADLLTARQLIQQRLVASQYKELKEGYSLIADAIQLKLNQAKPLTDYGKQRLEQQIKELIESVKIIAPDLNPIAQAEVNATANAMIKTGIDATLPSPSTVATISSGLLVEGETVGKWFSKLEDDLELSLSREVRKGVGAGLTNQEIAKNIIGDWAKRSIDKGGEPLKLSMRNALSLARTGTAKISSDARQAVFDKNESAIFGYTHVATLDSRTTTQCAARDGLKWRKDGKPYGHILPMIRPPLHFNCRSVLSPILAIDMATTRSSELGQVDAGTTFEDFMNKQGDEFAEQVLGKGRYNLYKSKKLSLTDLLDPRGLEPLSLDELIKKFG